jgi:hypothetical protein
MSASAEMMAERIEQVWEFADLEFGTVQNEVAVSPSQRRTPNLDRHERLGPDHRWAASSELRPARKPRRDGMRLFTRMLSFRCMHRRAGPTVARRGPHRLHHRCRSRLVGGAEALSGCTAIFNRFAFVDQGSCDLVDTLQRHMSSARVPGLMMAGARSVQQPKDMAARHNSWCSEGGMPRLHQLGGPVGRSINLHKTDIKSLSSRDAARRAKVVRVVSSTISIKCPTRSTKASPITR